MPSRARIFSRRVLPRRRIEHDHDRSASCSKQSAADAHHVRVLDRVEHLGLALQIVDLVHVEEVDSHAVLAEEDGLGRGLAALDGVRPWRRLVISRKRVTYRPPPATSPIFRRHLLAARTSSASRRSRLRAQAMEVMTVTRDLFAGFELDHRVGAWDPGAVSWAGGPQGGAAGRGVVRENREAP